MSTRKNKQSKNFYVFTFYCNRLQVYSSRLILFSLLVAYTQIRSKWQETILGQSLRRTCRQTTSVPRKTMKLQ